MRKILSAVSGYRSVLACVGAAWMAVAEAQTAAERFGLGMFTYQNRTFVGVVMRYPVAPQQIGGFVVELPAAAKAANVTGIPSDLLSIIDQWSTVGPKIKQIVAQVGPTLDAEETGVRVRLQSGGCPCAVRPAAGLLRVLQLPARCRERRRPRRRPRCRRRCPASGSARPTTIGRMNPRLFLIPNTPEVFIGDGDPVINWHADRRKDYEYECELLGVVGRPMRRVPVDQVKNYMFGYTNTNDISDRQARRPTRSRRTGSCRRAGTA